MSAAEWVRYAWPDGRVQDEFELGASDFVRIETVLRACDMVRSPTLRDSVRVTVELARVRTAQVELPVEALAEALRARGWTCTPPGEPQP